MKSFRFLILFRGRTARTAVGLGGRLLRRAAVFGATAALAAPLLSAEAEAIDAGRLFENGNVLYEKGDYGAAIDAYRRALSGGHVSAPLYFNLGNAFLKQDRLGLAIASYRRAEDLAPRDPDVAANLAFAREKVRGSSGPSSSRWASSLRALTLGELALIATLFLWAFCGLWIAGLLRPDAKRPLRGFLLASGAAMALFEAWLIAATLDRVLSEEAVVVAKESEVRYGPLEESKVAFKLYDGAELAVIDRKDDWLEVSAADGRIGWMPSGDAELLAAR